MGAGHKLRFRWDTFNVTNTPKFDVFFMDMFPDRQASFGRYYETIATCDGGAGRCMQFALRYRVLTSVGARRAAPPCGLPPAVNGALHAPRLNRRMVGYRSRQPADPGGAHAITPPNRRPICNPPAT